MVQTYRKFEDQGVQFVGLTTDGEEARVEIEGFQESADIPWATGLGAEETILQYGVEGFPTLFVIGRDGTVVWNSGMSGTLEEAIVQALGQELL